MDDYTVATEAFPDDTLLKLLLEALLLSRKGLELDAGQFVPQLLGRLTDTEVSDLFPRSSIFTIAFIIYYYFISYFLLLILLLLLLLLLLLILLLLLLLILLLLNTTYDLLCIS